MHLLWLSTLIALLWLALPISTLLWTRLLPYLAYRFPFSICVHKSSSFMNVSSRSFCIKPMLCFSIASIHNLLFELIVNFYSPLACYVCYLSLSTTILIFILSVVAHFLARQPCIHYIDINIDIETDLSSTPSAFAWLFGHVPLLFYRIFA
jgi:hypothetical protein